MSFVCTAVITAKEITNPATIENNRKSCHQFTRGRALFFCPVQTVKEAGYNCQQAYGNRYSHEKYLHINEYIEVEPPCSMVALQRLGGPLQQDGTGYAPSIEGTAEMFVLIYIPGHYHGRHYHQKEQ